MEFTGKQDLNLGTGSSEIQFTLMMVQKDNWIFAVALLGDNIGEGEADQYAKALVEAEPSDAPVVFESDGTSTGGFFDMLPADTDPMMADFQPLMDMDILNMEATPAM